MILLNPKQHRASLRRRALRRGDAETIAFFETKGKDKLLADYYEPGLVRRLPRLREGEPHLRDHVHAGRRGRADGRWDTWRICEFAEILGFYGLQYWYTWQVSVLGLGPIWMSKNEAIRQRTAQALEDGGIFAFGLSEKAHGADIYSTDMVLTPDGRRLAGERPQVLHRQRQRGGDRLDVRPHRRHATSTSSSPPTRGTRTII